MRPAASKPQGPLALFVDFVGSRIGAAVFSFGTIWLVTHHVPVPVAGVYIAALSYALLLSGFLDLGTGPGLVREAARGDVERHITVYVWTRAALTIAVMVVGAAGLWLAFPPDARAAGALGLGIIASSVYGVVG